MNTLEGGLLSCSEMSVPKGERITSMTTWGMNGGSTFNGLRATLSDGSSTLFGYEFGQATITEIPADIVGVAIGQDLKGGFQLTVDSGTCPDSLAINYIIMGCVFGLLAIAAIVYCVVRRNAKKQTSPDVEAPNVVAEDVRETLTESMLDSAYEKGEKAGDNRATVLTRDTMFGTVIETQRDSEITV